MRIIIFLIALIIIGLCNCSEKSKEPIKEKEIVSSNNGQPVDNQTNIIVDDIDVSPQKPANNQSKELTDFLPKSIPGTEKRPFKLGRRFENDAVVLTASCEYVFKNHGFLEYRIVDYGKKDVIPKFELKMFEKLPVISGKIVEEVQIYKGKGLTVIDESRNEGSFYGLINERYYLRIDAYNLEQNAEKIPFYIRYFDFKGIANK